MTLRSKRRGSTTIYNKRNVVHNYNGIFVTFQIGRDQEFNNTILERLSGTKHVNTLVYITQ